MSFEYQKKKDQTIKLIRYIYIYIYNEKEYSRLRKNVLGNVTTSFKRVLYSRVGLHRREIKITHTVSHVAPQIKWWKPDILPTEVRSDIRIKDLSILTNFGICFQTLLICIHIWRKSNHNCLHYLELYCIYGTYSTNYWYESYQGPKLVCRFIICLVVHFKKPC